MTCRHRFTRACILAGLAVAVLLLAEVAVRSHVSLGRWDRPDIPVHMRLGRLGSATWTNGAIHALRSWNNAGARFQFGWTRTRSSVVCDRSDGVTAVMWSRNACRSGRWRAWDDPRAVATTHHWVYRSSGRIADADVVFNLNKRWAVYDGPLRTSGGETVYDFRRVAVHEFGHVLGLNHPDDHGQSHRAIMNRHPSDIDRLQADDINGVRALYGTDPDAGSPDLVVDSLAVDDSTLVAGDIFTLSARVRNEGNTWAPGTTLRYLYWRSSARAWVVVGYDGVGSLAARASSPESIRLTAPSREGRHWYTACVASVTGETNTRNCGRNVVVTVTPDTDVPDLVVESQQVSATELVTGQPVTFTATVRNVGSATAEATTLRYYSRAEGGSWAAVGTAVVGSLAPSASIPISTTLTAPSSVGTHWYIACVASVTGETNRSNCGSSVQVTVTGGGGGGAPNLVVESPRVSDSQLTPGETFTFSVTVRNAGSATAEDARLFYYLEWPLSTIRSLEATEDVPVLLPSGTSSHSVTLTARTFEGPEYYACVRYSTPDAYVESCSDRVPVTVEREREGECVTNLGVVPIGTVVRENEWTGRCQAMHREGSYARYYSFTLSQQAWVEINLTSTVEDTYLFLLEGSGTGGTVRALDDDGGSGGNSRIANQNLSAGTYTIEATTFGESRKGDFRLDLEVSGLTTPVGGRGGPGVSNNVPDVTYRGNPANKEIGVVNVGTGRPRGESVAIEVGARDHQCEDGDRVEIRVYDGSSWRTVFSDEINNSWQTRTYAATVGNHYTVIAIALNGTGFKGPCSYADGNTGEMRVSYGGRERTTRWQAPGGSASVGVINVTP